VRRVSPRTWRWMFPVVRGDGMWVLFFFEDAELSGEDVVFLCWRACVCARVCVLTIACFDI